MKSWVALTAIAIAITGCSSRTLPAATTTVTVTASPPTMPSPLLPPDPLLALPTSPAPQTTTPRLASSYGPSGTYSVGVQPKGGLTDAIPPGRYRAELAPGETVGWWVRCSNEICGNGNANFIIDSAYVMAGVSVMEIHPTDVAVNLLNVTLTRVE